MRQRFTLPVAAFALSGMLFASLPAAAEPEGLVVLSSRYSYQTLVERLDTAVADAKMGVVTRASATVGARKVLDKEIPGNMVVGVFHPRFAVPMLEASVPAGIEAPIRFYIAEEADGTASLRYRKPSAVFAPYGDRGDALDTLAR